jgi:hypothetical protein
MEQKDIGGRRRTSLTASRWSRRNSQLTIFFAAVLVAGATTLPGSAAGAAGGVRILAQEVQSLDGSGNNVANPTWGQRNTAYSRVAPVGYRDGISVPNDGPNPRFISNRIINDNSQNIFTGRGSTQWLWQWGQFVDHDIALAAPCVPPPECAGGGLPDNIPFNANDPMEQFRNDLGVIQFTRDTAHPGTGTSITNPRQHTNTLSSYLDASNVYGLTPDRLDWLRDGSVDGNPANNGPTLMLPGGFLPQRDARGDVATAPTTVVDGRLRATPNRAVVAGDVRANENLGLTATHTLFVREHNRIVSQLPNTLTDEEKFQIARRVVIAEQQYITYTQFLPSAGVQLPAYTGYRPNVNASIGQEFATVGYRSHSMVHGEFELEVDADRFTPAQLASFEAQGLEVQTVGDEVAIAVPLNVMFFNSPLLRQLGLGPLLQAIGAEAQYNNDEMFDNHMRSILFQIPTNASHECQEPVDPACFRGVTDLGAIDIQRTHDHGIPNYNRLRQAFGLPPRASFTAITGEATDAFPPGLNADNPASLQFTSLRDKNGAPIALDSPVANLDATEGTRRTTKAARLRAVFGTVDRVDAFTGMLSEPHVAGTEFGELQLAMWRTQFTALRDGDRYHYASADTTADLNSIRTLYGIDFRRTLAQIISSNTDIPAAELSPNVFVIPAGTPLDPSHITGTQSNRCIDVPFSSTADNTGVEIFDCGAADNQNWNQQADGTIRVANGGKCLDAFGGPVSRVGDPAVIFACNNSATQRWRFQSDGRIVNLANGRCLDAEGANTANRTRLILFTCNATAPNQRFIR